MNNFVKIAWIAIFLSATYMLAGLRRGFAIRLPWQEGVLMGLNLIDIGGELAKSCSQACLSSLHSRAAKGFATNIRFREKSL